jgi:hypothetical protein
MQPVSARIAEDSTRGSMIAEADRRLKQWAAALVSGADIRLAAPADAADQRIVSLHLLELVQSAPAQTSHRLPLQLLLRYLVTTWAEDPEDAHRMLSELVFAAMEHPDFEVEFDPLPAAMWAAFKATPRPSFLLRVPLRKERPEPRIGRVLKPVELRLARVTELAGVVVGPDELPLSEVRVELTTLRQATRTDAQGRFRFECVPAEPAAKPLRVQAKGKEFWFNLDHQAGERGPIVLHLDVMEG